MSQQAIKSEVYMPYATQNVTKEETLLRAYGETFWQNFIWGASGNYSSTLSQPSRRHKAEDAVEDIEQNVTNYVNVKAR